MEYREYKFSPWVLLGTIFNLMWQSQCMHIKVKPCQVSISGNISSIYHKINIVVGIVHVSHSELSFGQLGVFSRSYSELEAITRAAPKMITWDRRLAQQAQKSLDLGRESRRQSISDLRKQQRYYSTCQITKIAQIFTYINTSLASINICMHLPL